MLRRFVNDFNDMILEFSRIIKYLDLYLTHVWFWFLKSSNLKILVNSSQLASSTSSVRLYQRFWIAGLFPTWTRSSLPTKLVSLNGRSISENIILTQEMPGLISGSELKKDISICNMYLCLFIFSYFYTLRGTCYLRCESIFGLHPNL